MLTGTATGARVSGRSTARALLPAARGLPRGTIAAVLAMAATPSTVLLLQGADDFTGAVTAAVLLGGATAAYFVDDPAGETVSACPISLGRRRLLRLTAIALGVAVTLVAVILMAVGGGPTASLHLADDAAELLAVSGLAAASAGLVARSGGAAPGSTGAVAGALSALVISALAVRFSAFPTLASPAHHDRWWIVAVAGWVVAAWTSRD